MLLCHKAPRMRGAGSCVPLPSFDAFEAVRKCRLCGGHGQHGGPAQTNLDIYVYKMFVFIPLLNIDQRRAVHEFL